MNYWETIGVGFIGSIIGATTAAFIGWFQIARVAEHKFAFALFRIEHALNHRKSENIYDTFTDDMVFEIWDTGMAYCALLPFGFRRGIKTKIGYLLGLMETLEGDRVKHSLSDRSLPSVPNAFRYITEIFVMLKYKKK